MAAPGFWQFLGNLAEIAYKAVIGKYGPIAQFTALVALDAGIRAISRQDLPGGNLGSRDVSVRGGTEYAVIVYGEVKVAGTLRYSNTSGTDNEYLWRSDILAGHEIEDITDVWLDDEYFEAGNDFSWDTADVGEVNSGAYSGYVKFWKLLGTSTQTANADLVSAFTDITSDHRARGRALLEARLLWDESSNSLWAQKGPPANLAGLVKGKNDIYDPRLDSGGAGDDPSNASFQAWTDNPILIVADYMTDSRVGMSVSTDKIDWQTIEDEANYCDVLVPIPGADAVQKRFTANGTLTTGETHRENIIALLSACNGRMSYRSGKFVITAGRLGQGANLVTGDDSTFDSSVGNWSAGAGTGTVSHATDKLEITGADKHAVLAVSGLTVGSTYVATVMRRESGGVSQNAGVGWSANSNGSSPTTSEEKSNRGSQYNVAVKATATTMYLTIYNDEAGSFTSAWDNVEVYKVTDVNVDRDWFVDDVAFKAGPPTKAERVNYLDAIYNSPDEDYQAVEALRVSSASLLSRDNSEELGEDLELPFTNNEYMAQRLAFRVLNQSHKVRYTFPCNYKALRCAPHVAVNVDVDELSLSDELLRVREYLFRDMNDQTGIEIELVEDDAATYADPDENQYSVRSASGVITWGLSDVPAPTGLTATAKQGGVLLEWNFPALGNSFDVIKLYRSDTDDRSAASVIWQGRAESYFDILAADETKYYWITAETDDLESDFHPDTMTTTATATATGFSAGNYNLITDPIGIHRNKYYYFVDADTWELLIDDEGAYWDRGTWTGTDTSTIQVRAQFWIRITPGTTYTLSAEANLSGRSAGNLVVDVLTYPLDKTASELDDFTGIVWSADTSDWERDSATISGISSSAEYAMVRIFTEGLDATTAQIRRLKLEKGSEATSFTNDLPGSPVASGGGANLDFEEGGVNWEAISGDWQIIVDDDENAKAGTAYATISETGGGIKIFQSDWTFALQEDVVRILFGGAMRFSSGSTATGGVFRIRYSDGAGSFITTSTITGYIDTTNTDWAVTTLFANPPSSAVFAQLQIGVVGMTAGTLYVDDCFMLRMLADSDIDALETTNGPNENNADRTSFNTAASISGQGDLATLDGNVIISDGSSFPAGTTYPGQLHYRTDLRQWYRRDDSNSQWDKTEWDALELTNAPFEADADVTIPGEGSWTPIIWDSSNGPGGEGQSIAASGYYKEIARDVYMVSFAVTMSGGVGSTTWRGSLSTSSFFKIGNLPTAHESLGSNLRGICNIYGVENGTSATYQGAISNGADYITIVDQSGATLRISDVYGSDFFYGAAIFFV